MESFMPTDAFVVIDEIATAIKDRFAAGGYLDPNRMMRRMPKDDVGTGAFDQKPGKTAALFVYVVSPVPAPMDGDDDNVVRSSPFEQGRRCPIPGGITEVRKKVDPRPAGSSCPSAGHAARLAGISENKEASP